MNQHLINLALALAAGELVHNLIESQEARKKVDWLRLTMAGKPYKDNLPFKVDTRAKSYSISFVGLVVTTAIFYFIFTLLNLSAATALWTIIILLVLAYTAVAFLLDKYHVEIHRLINPLRKKIK
jgi:hypothetical protein